MAQRIVFFKFGSFSHINPQIARLLREHFADFELETVDVVAQLIKPRKFVLLMNMLHVFWHYGLDLLRRRRRLRECFFRTPYLFRKVKALCVQFFDGRDAAFTFQTQSIFDTSVPGVPHFLYTDHTNLANRQYTCDTSERLSSPSWLACEKEVYRNATINFTMSRHVAESIRSEYGCDGDRVVCAHVGANADINRSVVPRRDYEAKKILFVGVNWQRKGGPELVEAFRRVRERVPDAKLTIVGCSPEIDIDGCEVVGRVPVEQVGRYFEQASLFCLPTRREPFGVVCLEAHLYGLAVVATPVGALPEYIQQGKTGYLVQPGDVEQLTDALTSLLSDPAKCRAFGRAGFEAVRHQYTWENVGKIVERHVRQVLPEA